MVFYCFFLFVIMGVMVLDKMSTFIHCSNVQLSDDSRILPNEYAKKNVFLMVAFLLLFCFSAFRFDVGWDYLAYYDTVKYNIQTNIVGGEEFATILLIELSRSIGIYNLFFVVNSFICLFLIYKTINKYSVDPWLSLLFFLCFPLYFLNSLSVIRFFTALAITFYGFKYIEQKRPIPYIVLVVIAILFHKASLIAFVFYLARYIKLGTFKLVILLASLPVIANLLNGLVLNYLPKYAVYTKETASQEGTKAIVFFLILAFIALLLRKKITDDDEPSRIYLNIFFMGIAIYLMFYAQGTMGHRLSLFGTIYGLLVVPKMISLFNNAIVHFYLKLLFYTLLVAMFLYIINSGAATYIPYRTIFE
ncbi:EpsG family protein [Solibacillus daqui]|uniref:EpsG family protein n=1 Tax=Solibacillus daqui TaxID=2912187 RepID=UPI002365013D|nr:EpsG family protein [Solibacillus daqui]